MRCLPTLFLLVVVGAGLEKERIQERIISSQIDKYVYIKITGIITFGGGSSD